MNRVQSIQVQEDHIQGHIGLRTCPRPKKVKKSLAFLGQPGSEDYFSE